MGAEATTDRATVFTFLERILDKFSLVIATEMKRISGAGVAENPDKISNLQEEVDQVKGIMVANIDVIMERGEKLDLLIDKTENLSASSVTFRTTSRNLQRAMWWKNMKLTVGAGLGVVVFLYILVSLSCGGLAWQNCV